MDKNHTFPSKQRRKKNYKTGSKQIDQEERFTQIRLCHQKYRQKLENYKSTLYEQLKSLIFQLQRKKMEIQDIFNNSIVYSISRQQMELLQRVQFQRQSFSLENMDELKNCERLFIQAEYDLNKITGQFVKSIWILTKIVGRDLPLYLDGGEDHLKLIEKYEQEENRKKMIIAEFDEFLKQDLLKNRRRRVSYKSDSLFDGFQDNLSFLASEESGQKSIFLKSFIHQAENIQSQLFNSNFQSKDLFFDKSGRVQSSPLKNSSEQKPSSPKRQPKKRGRKKISQKRISE